MFVVPLLTTTRPPALANGLKIAPLPAIAPPTPFVNRPVVPKTVPLLRLNVPLFESVAPLRLNGKADERLNVPRLTLAALGEVLRLSVPPAMLRLPSLSSPAPA